MATSAHHRNQRSEFNAFQRMQFETLSQHQIHLLVCIRSRVRWVTFPAEVGGWQSRKCSKVPMIELIEVPLRIGFNTGIPDAPTSKGYSRLPSQG